MEKKPISPFRIVLIIGAAIFAAEFLVMVILGAVGPLSFVAEAVTDASLLTILLSPIFYFLLIRKPVYAEPLTGVEKAPSPMRAVAVLVAAIFFSEMLLMAILDNLPPLQPLVGAFIDSSFLLLMTIPFLYYYLFLPFVKNIALLKEAELRLWDANVRLEEKVAERTRKLSEINLDLETEIGERIKAEEELLREKERAQKYLDMAGVIFLVLDTQGTISMVNRRGCAILGCNCIDESIIGRNWFDAFVPEDEKERAKGDFQKLIGEIGEANPYTEGSIVTRSGEKRLIGWRATRLNGGDGKVTAVLFAGEDVTNMKLKAEMLLRTEKLASVGTLSAGVAHEILNPLNIISTIAQLMLMDYPSGKIHDHANDILAQVKRATRITDSLRKFAHQKKGRVAILNVNDVIDKALLLLEHDLKRNNIVVVKNYQRDLPAIEADEEKLMQVFVNLTSNARDALRGEEGGRIAVSTRGLNDGVEIQVTDNGPGIPSEIIERVFDPFFTTKDPDKGTGLGLSVAHTIIHDHFGSIYAESGLSNGACFRIWLPPRFPAGNNMENDGSTAGKA